MNKFLKDKILIASYGGGHINVIAPLIEKLAEKYEVIPFGFTTAAAQLKKKYSSTLEYLNFIDNYYKDYKKFSKIIYQHENTSVLTKEESEVYHGVNFKCLVDSYGLSEAKKMFSKKGRGCFLPISFMEYVIKVTNPDLIITTNSPRSERALLKAAHNRKTKSICILDLFGIAESEWLKDDTYGNILCVINKEVNDYFVSLGRPQKSIDITGNPAFDSLEKANESNDEKIRILYALSYEPPQHFIDETLKGDVDLPYKIEKQLRKFIRSNQDKYNLKIRYHPNHTKKFKAEKNVVLSKSSVKIEEELKHTDIVVVTSSTVGYQAYLLGLKVISVELSVFSKDMPYEKFGMSTAVTDLNDLENAIENITNKNNGVKKKVQNATAAISRIVDNILEP